jgi:hypothetical protein
VWIFWLLGILGLTAVARKKGEEMKTMNVKSVIVNPTEDVIDSILKTIRTVESGNNYTVANGTSSASGAYQFLDTTWGGYGGFKRAKDAPPKVQDEKARINVLAILSTFGNDVRYVPAAWYVGINGARKIDWNAPPPPGNHSTVNQYVNKWMTVFLRQAVA